MKRIAPTGWWFLVVADGLAILFLSLSSGRRGRLTASLGMAGLLCLVLSCSSGNASNGGGGGGGGGGGPTPTSVTLSTSAVKAQSGANVTLTAKVTSAHPLSGDIDFVDSGNGFGLAGVGVVNGQATVQLNNLSVGTHVIVAQYTGDPNNLPSKTNGSINQVITGTAQIGVQGATSTLGHAASVNVTIQ
jgi:hypothetical protein